VSLDELADGLRGHHHDAHGYHDGQNHDRNIFGKADSGNDRVEREDDVDEGDLDERHDEVRSGALLDDLFGAFEALVNFVGAFCEQEQAAAEQDEVAARDGVAESGEQLVGEAHDPSDREQERDAAKHGQPEAEYASRFLLLGGHPAHNDRQKNDIVDAEDDFKRRQRQERDPRLRAENPFHIVESYRLIFRKLPPQNRIGKITVHNDGD